MPRHALQRLPQSGDPSCLLPDMSSAGPHRAAPAPPPRSHLEPKPEGASGPLARRRAVLHPQDQQQPEQAQRREELGSPCSAFVACSPCQSPTSPDAGADSDAAPGAHSPLTPPSRPGSSASPVFDAGSLQQGGREPAGDTEAQQAQASDQNTLLLLLAAMAAAQEGQIGSHGPSASGTAGDLKAGTSSDSAGRRRRTRRRSVAAAGQLPGRLGINKPVLGAPVFAVMRRRRSCCCGRTKLEPEGTIDEQAPAAPTSDVQCTLAQAAAGPVPCAQVHTTCNLAQAQLLNNSWNVLGASRTGGEIDGGETKVRARVLLTGEGRRGSALVDCQQPYSCCQELLTVSGGHE